MSHNDTKEKNHLLELVSNLSSQSNESSNIILQAISQGITNGLSQGIASGNISVTFNDVIALASLFKSQNNLSHRILDHILPNIDTPLSPPTNTQEESTTSAVTRTRNLVDAAKGSLAHSISHGENLDSLGLPSSVHVFDVTGEEIPALEHTVSHRVSENADDRNTISSLSSYASGNGNVTTISNESLPTNVSSSKKRCFQSVSIDELSRQSASRPRIDSCLETIGIIRSIDKLMEYVSVSPHCLLPSAAKSAKNKLLKNHDVCKREDVSYCNQSVVILESISRTSTETFSESPSNLFDNSNVTKVIAVERPRSTNAQLYIAHGLSTKFHFSCLTALIPTLTEAIREYNNKEVELLFVPSCTDLLDDNSMTVLNTIPIPSMFQDNNAKKIYESLIEFGEKVASDNFAHSGKRSNHSFSVGLQTMYAHQQHCARFCMLPHSRPHVPYVKIFPSILSESILTAYDHIARILNRDHNINNQHPFELEGPAKENQDGYVSERLKLRGSLISFFRKQQSYNKLQVTLPSKETMFEACTVQPTDALGFHKDSMNCSILDNTIALIIPTNAKIPSSHSNQQICLSYLFYSRKCVGQHSTKMLSIYNSIEGVEGQCDLTRFCLKSIMNIGGVYDYQSSLFEADLSLNTIASALENNPNHSCADIEHFSGLRCIKHGAAFDKMGYYSIFVNFFLNLYYKGIATNIDDSISVSMFFGLVCNGTSAIAGVWSCIYENDKAVLKWLQKRSFSHKLFDCLMKLYEKRYKMEKGSTILYGNCKLNRFQYSNYASNIYDNAKPIHDQVLKFIKWRATTGNKKAPSLQHAYLYNSLKKFKGIGPLSFNQFWHSLCLSGVVPPGYLQCSSVAPSSGPAKVISTFYPYIKKSDVLSAKLDEVTKQISSLGVEKISQNFLENMLCECHRIVIANRLFHKTMTPEERCELLLNDKFQEHIRNAKTTRNPDIYYRNPYTNEWQHLFRVIGKELLMRPSNLANRVTGSVNLRCVMEYDNESGKLNVTWSGTALKSVCNDIRDLFI